MKPTRAGWYWRRIGRTWQPVVVARTRRFEGSLSELVWQPFSSPFAYDVIADGRWGERIKRTKAKP